MRAVAVVPGTTDVRLVERPEPHVTSASQVKLKVLQVGICGTDRELAGGHRAEGPPGSPDLVLGHEMFGQVVEKGSAVSGVEEGDYAVFTVRRGCGQAGCAPCATNRSDMCQTGAYTERGIKAQDGFQTELVVDEAQYLVRVPNEMAAYGVLAEPMSVAEKALDVALRIQAARLPGFEQYGGNLDRWLEGRQVLVAGLGPIGLLAAVALRLRGATVLGLDVVDSASARPALLRQIGGTYVNGREVRTDLIDDTFGQIDLIFEATGVASLEFELIDALGINGVYVLTGIPGGDRPVDIHGAELMRQLVLANQVLVGSVNANRGHFAQAVADLQSGEERWPGAVKNVITHAVPVDAFEEVLRGHQQGEIKATIRWE